MIMKKIWLTFVLMLSLTVITHAQDYETAIGLRGGLYNGVTAKHFLTTKSAAEGILLTRWQGFSVTGLYELHKYTAFDVDRLNWYYGGGAHLGIWDGTYATWLGTAGYQVVIGLDAILGIEYNLEEIPINISLDWKPAFNLIGYSGPNLDGAAFSIRYTL